MTQYLNKISQGLQWAERKNQFELYIYQDVETINLPRTKKAQVFEPFRSLIEPWAKFKSLWLMLVLVFCIMKDILHVIQIIEQV